MTEPRHSPAETAPTIKAEPPLRVLIVEDSEIDAGLVLHELKQHGFGANAQRVASSQELESALARQSWDLVISDYAMHQFNGLEALRIVKASGFDLPFILISGTIGEELAVAAMKAGANDYLLKDQLARLGAAVKRELRDAKERHARRRAEEMSQAAEARNRELLKAAERSRQVLLSMVEDLKRAEASLRESDTRFQEVTSQMGEWVWEMNADGLYTYASPVVESILGYRPDELVGKCHYYDLFIPSERTALLQASLDHTRARKPFNRFRNHCLHKDGHRVLLETSGIPILDAQGNLQGYRGVDSDISERDRAEKEIRTFRTISDKASYGSAIVLMDGTLSYVNEAFARMHGWKSRELLGQPFTVCHNDQQINAMQEHLKRILSDGGFVAREIWHQRRDGSVFPTLMSITLIRDPAGQPEFMSATAIDITEQKKLEAQFLRAQRLEAVGALASGIAHDLNNILAPILMTAPLLSDTITDGESRNLLKTIDTCARRGADVIKQLLTFARGTPNARVPLPVRHFLRDMEKIIRETFPRNITPVVDVSENLWTLLGDPTQLHQVLLNLCVNARDAMPEGGTLTLEAHNAPVDATFAAMTPGAQSGAYVRIRVADTGTGIAPEHLAQIFDPFFTTKEEGKGTGLGLATVQGIVKGHEGFLRVDSELGRGTVFELFFPASPQLDSATAAPPEAPPPRGHDELVLVVDDETELRDSLGRALEALGYCVLKAANGAEGLATFSVHQTDIRAVLTDMMMPVMNGPALILALRAIQPRLIILGMTGLPDRKEIKGLEQLQVSAMLEKPFACDQLAQALHTALSSLSSPHSQENAE